MSDKTYVYLYTRVSTAMQVDGYSLDAHKTKMKSFCEFNDYEIAGEYEDAGISGKSTENRIELNRMMDDIKTGKDDVSYVLVFKLEEYRGRKFAGRQKHDAAWTQSYNDFAVKFESGMTIMEIVAEGKISRRTAYRYKAYYDALRQREFEDCQ